MFQEFEQRVKCEHNQWIYIFFLTRLWWKREINHPYVSLSWSTTCVVEAHNMNTHWHICNLTMSLLAPLLPPSLHAWGVVAQFTCIHSHTFRRMFPHTPRQEHVTQSAHAMDTFSYTFTNAHTFTKKHVQTCVSPVSHSVTCVIPSRVCHVGLKCNKNTNDTWVEVEGTLNNNTMKVQSM